LLTSKCFQEQPRSACVLADDAVSLAQRFQRAQRDVAEVPYGSRHEVQCPVCAMSHPHFAKLVQDQGAGDRRGGLCSQDAWAQADAHGALLTRPGDLVLCETTLRPIITATEAGERSIPRKAFRNVVTPSDGAAMRQRS